MKAKITRPDGTIIEAEGTPAEIRELLAAEPQPTVSGSFDPDMLRKLFEEQARRQQDWQVLPSLPAPAPYNPDWIRYGDRPVDPLKIIC